MPEQNFKNHAKYIPLYHFVAFMAIGLALAGALINMYKAYNAESGRVNAAVIVLTVFALGIVCWYSRVFALKAQDKAIRAEENFRHFIAAGKPLDSRLSMGQIVALRFAGDNEFVELSKKAVSENMSAKEIKMAIKNWKSDHDRA